MKTASHARMHVDDPEAALINDAQFLQELEGFEREDDHLSNAVIQGTTYGEAVDALDDGMFPNAAARAFVPSDDDQPPALEETFDAAPAPIPAEPRVPFAVAALVLAACLAAGAMTAAYVFHARVAQITAPRSASR